MAPSDSGGSTGPARCRHSAVLGVEPVVRQELPAAFGHEVHRLDDVVEHALVDEVVEVHAHPARLDPLAAARSPARTGASAPIDAQQAVPVGSGAGAAAAGLDAEQVVEQGDHEVVVQVAASVLDHERDDRQALGVLVAQHLEVLVASQLAMARRMKFSSRSRIMSGPTASFSWKTRPARMLSMIAGVPPSSRCSMSVMYLCSRALTYVTVPPPGTVGTRLWQSCGARRARRGCPAPR